MKLETVEIQLENCAKTYDKGVRVLEPLDLTIAAGETLVLLGPSGCGKTTTLRLIAGLEQPDAGGRVRFGGQDVTAQPIEARQVGMVFQSYALFPNMTARENVGYGLRIRKVPKDLVEQRVNELLELTRMGAHGDKPIPALSGGQKQRIALARALAPQPRVLLLDEPLTALDAQLRELLRAEMNTLLRGLGVTTIYVTHDQAEAMALGDRIVVMSAGRIEQIGSPREVYYQPANARVAEFIGTMNRLEGVWRDHALHCAGGRVPAHEGAAPADAIWFRPEDVELVGAADAQLHGVVAQASFLGERTRLVVQGLGPSAIRVDVSGRAAPAVGERIGLRLRPEVWQHRISLGSDAS